MTMEGELEPLRGYLDMGSGELYGRLRVGGTVYVVRASPYRGYRPRKWWLQLSLPGEQPAPEVREEADAPARMSRML